jgi:hypothetical protein
MSIERNIKPDEIEFFGNKNYQHEILYKVEINSLVENIYWPCITVIFPTKLSENVNEHAFFNEKDGYLRFRRYKYFQMRFSIWSLFNNEKYDRLSELSEIHYELLEKFKTTTTTFIEVKKELINKYKLKNYNKSLSRIVEIVTKNKIEF